MDRLTCLDIILKAAGIPIHGVTMREGAPVIQFLPSATASQKNAASTILAGYDFRPRRSRSFASIMADIAALSNADRAKLLSAVCANFLRENPIFASQFSINIDGDEPDV